MSFPQNPSIGQQVVENDGIQVWEYSEYQSGDEVKIGWHVVAYSKSRSENDCK